MAAPLMNQMIAPPAGLTYVHPQYSAVSQARSVAPLTQLAAAAAVTSGGGRNRLLGASSTIGGSNPFGLTTGNAANALAGLYANSGYPSAAATAGLLGLQGRGGTGAVPLIPDLPGRQRHTAQVRA